MSLPFSTKFFWGFCGFPPNFFSRNAVFHQISLAILPFSTKFWQYIGYKLPICTRGLQPSRCSITSAAACDGRGEVCVDIYIIECERSACGRLHHHLVLAVVFAEELGRAALLALEYAVEVRHIIKSAIVANFSHRHCACEWGK